MNETAPSWPWRAANAKQAQQPTKTAAVRVDLALTGLAHKNVEKRL